jgi:hypothetical protein
MAVTMAMPVAATTSLPLARWEMNEPPGASTMVDSGPNGINGAIGSAVMTGADSGSGVIGYRWSHTKPNTPPAQPERLVQVADSRVNPGTRDYAVTIRYRTTRSYGNVIQKGQSGSAGGYFKFQQPQGVMSCLFRGVDGSKSVNSKVALNDGEWHTVRCERTAAGVTMTVDNGAIVRRGWGPTGSISNKGPLTIAGKLNCDQVQVTCDYFAGDIDWVTIETS